MVTKPKMGIQPPRVYLRPWSPADLPLLQRLMGDPHMTAHLGGPETTEQILARHRRYCQDSVDGRDAMFAILAGPGEMPAGSIGYWERVWEGQAIWETGWSVLPEFQGQGIATQAARLLAARARSQGKHCWLHAFPGIDNQPSNAICRKVGFSLQGEVDFEYPPGRTMRCNDWRLNLCQQGERSL